MSLREARLGNRALIVLTWSVLATQPIAASPQAGSGANARQTFEVASVRPDAPRLVSWAGATVRVMPGGRFVATGAPLAHVILFAYGLQNYQLIDSGFSSLLQQRFDIDALSGTGDVPSQPRFVIGPMQVMVQNLLAERFRLRVRWEEPEQSVLVLVRSRVDGSPGPGLRASSVDCLDPESRKRVAPGDCTLRQIDGQLHAPGRSMSAFADYLSLRLQRPVFDRTNLEGTFDIRMTVSSEDFPISPLSAQLAAQLAVPARTGDADSKPPLAMALKEQLGLALETRRERIPRLVVEHVERPSPN